MSVIASLFKPKPVYDQDDAIDGHGTYKKTLTAWDLMSIGIGCIIGAGIFTLTGDVASKIAGPAVVVSYLIAGLACAFSALCCKC
jgi:APA family basic amino acid/polyamine antiporter